MFSWLCRFLFKLWGWKTQGIIPHELPKKLYVVIPHTSNWDFPLGILLKFGHKMKVGFIGKSSLFKWPFGWFFRALGGIPVDRKRTQGFINSVVSTINSRDYFTIAIAPEGTRGKVEKIKSGFYYIAKLADIPIVYVKFDWGRKIVAFDAPRKVKESLEEELDFVNEHFHGVVGKIPRNTFGYPFQ